MFRELLRPLVHHAKLARFQADWRRRNPHNRTVAKNIFPPDRVSVGRYTYGGLRISFFGNPEESVTIGSFCSIAGDVQILAGGEHDYRLFSTYPMRENALGETVVEARTKGPVTIRDDVWIGHGVVVLSGVTIGQGAVIGAGSIVAKNVPEYAIYARDRVIGYRFDQATIEKLVRMNYCNLEIEDLRHERNWLVEAPTERFFESRIYDRLIQRPRTLPPSSQT